MGSLVMAMWLQMSPDTVKWSSIQTQVHGAMQATSSSARHTTRSPTGLASTALTLPASLTPPTTCIVPQGMQSSLRCLSVCVIHIAILSLRRYCRFYHTLFGVNMVTRQSRGRVGLGILGRGILMLGGCLNHFTSTRFDFLSVLLCSLD